MHSRKEPIEQLVNSYSEHPHRYQRATMLATILINHVRYQDSCRTDPYLVGIIQDEVHVLVESGDDSLNAGVHVLVQPQGHHCPVLETTQKTPSKFTIVKRQCLGSGMFIPDHGSEFFSIPDTDPGSNSFSNPGSTYLSIFKFNPKTVSKLSEI